jgi:hypothetical protein
MVRMLRSRSGMPTSTRWLRTLVASVIGLGGCDVSTSTPTTESNLPPQGARLTDVTYPSSFMFQVTRPLAVHVTAATNVSERTALEIFGQDEAVLYRGSIAAGVALTVRVPVTHELASLRFVATDAAGHATTRTVSVDPNDSALDVQLGGG